MPTDMHRPLKVAVVGASMSADPAEHQRFAVRAHLPVLQALRGQFETVATCTTRMETALMAARHFGVPHAYDSVERMLRESPGIDIVCASVRPVDQHAVVMQALEAGKHVYCEHPFGTSLAEAQAMRDLARRKGVRSVVGHEHHYEPAMLEMQARIAADWIGSPISFGISFFNDGMIHARRNDRPWLAQGDMGGPRAWRTGHSLERVMSALGGIAAVCADMSVYSPPGPVPVTQTNNVNLLLRTRSGATGCLQVCLSAWHGTGWNFQVYGSEGMLMIRDEPARAAGGVQGDPRKVEVALYGARSGDAALQRIEPDPAHCRVQGISGTNFAVAQMWAAFGDCIRNGRDCHPDFDDEVVMHRLWDAAERSMQGRGWVEVAA